MHVRTSYGPYVDRVEKYLEKLSNLVNHMQFTSSYGKGPIIAFQVRYLFYALSSRRFFVNETRVG
jgi:hypothetical protein